MSDDCHAGAGLRGCERAVSCGRTLATWPGNPTVRCLPKRNSSMSTKVLAGVFMAAWFPTAPNWKQPECPSE